MNEFDYIIREAREIFDFYGMNREKPMIDEIIYNSDYALRHFLGDNKIFHDKIQQSSINITRLRTSGGRSNRSADKIIVVGI